MFYFKKKKRKKNVTTFPFDSVTSARKKWNNRNTITATKSIFISKEMNRPLFSIHSLCLFAFYFQFKFNQMRLMNNTCIESHSSVHCLLCKKKKCVQQPQQSDNELIKSYAFCSIFFLFFSNEQIAHDDWQQLNTNCVLHCMRFQIIKKNFFYKWILLL